MSIYILLDHFINNGECQHLVIGSYTIQRTLKFEQIGTWPISCIIK